MKPGEFDATVDQWCAALTMSRTSLVPAATLRPRSLSSPISRRSVALPQISLELSGATPSVHPPAELKLAKVLGEGGMGQVHLATQSSLGREVAVKTLRPEAASENELLLVNEACVTGSLEHPGIVPVHALGVDEGGRPLIVMKRIEGVTWSELLENPTHEAWSWLEDNKDRLHCHIEILIKLCDALEFAHSRGVLHRDIKPDNVMVGRFGEVYLVDWGIAVSLKEGIESRIETCGTPAFMAPEMVLGSPLGPYTDVYLLGSTLHLVLTGEPRHRGKTLPELLRSAVDSTPPSYETSVPVELAELATCATARDPQARPRSVRNFRAALTDFLRHRGSAALVETASERLRRLLAMLDEADPVHAPNELQLAHRLATEARFGFVQALISYPENRVASSQLERCLAAMLELELRQKNLSGARVLLSELKAPPVALAQRVEALSLELSTQNARLERLERDQDVGFHAGKRIAAVGVLLLAAALVATYSATKAFTPQGLLGIAGFEASLVAIVLAVLWKPMMENAFNRRVAALLALCVGALVLNRLGALITGDSVPTILFHDSMLLTLVVAVGAATITRGFFLASGVFALTALVALFSPAYIESIFPFSVVLALLVVGLLWWKRA